MEALGIELGKLQGEERLSLIVESIIQIISRVRHLLNDNPALLNFQVYLKFRRLNRKLTEERTFLLFKIP
jgi:hypothetical protein